MTVAENLARLFPLHYQRIVELSHESDTQALLARPSQGGRWSDIAGLFLFSGAAEGFDYWNALAFGAGVQ